MSKELPRVDLHIHSIFSDGESTVADIARMVKVKKLDMAGLADHYSSGPGGERGRMGSNRLKRYLSEVQAASLLKGVEVDIYEDGDLSLDPSEKPLFDYVIAGVHKMAGIAFWGDPTPIPDPKGFVENMRVVIIEAMESKVIDVIAHLTWLPEDIRGMASSLITDDWVDSVVRTAASLGVAIEINGSWTVPDEQVVKKCLKEGVKLSMGSDAHRASDVGNIKYPLTLLSRLGAGLDDLYLPRKLQG